MFALIVYGPYLIFGMLIVFYVHIEALTKLT